MYAIDDNWLETRHRNSEQTTTSPQQTAVLFHYTMQCLPLLYEDLCVALVPIIIMVCG